MEGFACVKVSFMALGFQDPSKSIEEHRVLLDGEPEPLDTRGSALQETLLSDRLLSFGDNEITW